MVPELLLRMAVRVLLFLSLPGGSGLRDISRSSVYTQLIHNCELPGIAGQATAPAVMPGFCQETWLKEEPLDHHVLTPLPGGRQLPLLAPASPESAQLAAAVDRFLALRDFRSKLYAGLTSRADALFELADAVLCAGHAVTSLVQLCLEPEFTRGHGALYDALPAGRIDDEKLFFLLASELPQAVDGPAAREWIAEHDVIDHGLLEQALAGLLPDDAAQVRDACARGSRLRFAAGATAYPRPDAWCSPGRQHVHNGACHCRGSSRTAPGWEDQFTAATGHLRTAWAALADVARTVPATRTAQTITQVRNVLRRLRAAGHGIKAAPLFVFDAGYSAAALTDGLAGCPVHVLVRLAAGSVFYADPVTWQGRHGRPARRGAAVHCLEPADFTADTGHGPRGRGKPLPPNPEPRRGAHRRAGARGDAARAVRSLHPGRDRRPADDRRGDTARGRARRRAEGIAIYGLIIGILFIGKA